MHVLLRASTAHTANADQLSDSTQTVDSAQTSDPQVSLFTIPAGHGSLPVDSASIWKTISKRDIQMWYYTGYSDLLE
ncbi:MAG: hypothetical protein ACK45R_09755, partial [Candidatus Kapaibacterium sp.]